jgi:hypothetical protein
MGSTFKGPIAANNGTAGCNYDGGTNATYVLFGSSGMTQSQFAAQAHSDMGPTTAPVSGIGAAAFSSTAYGHAQIEVWVSSSYSFTITVSTNTGTVAPDNLAQCEGVARAILAS